MWWSRVGFVPHFLFRKKQLFVDLQCISWNGTVEMCWLFLMSLAFSHLGKEEINK